MKPARITQMLAALPAATLLAAVGHAAVISNVSYSVDFDGFDSQIATGDLISGAIATELPGDLGWHPVNPATTFGSLDPNGLPEFTDDGGGAGLSGLLNDFPGDGTPTKLIDYSFTQPTDIGQINVLSGNENPDGRIFSTVRVLVSTDGGTNYSPIQGFSISAGPNSEGYFTTAPYGGINKIGNTANVSGDPNIVYESTFLEINDSTGFVATGVTNIQFNFFASNNSDARYQDPFIGVNPFTGVDDGIAEAPISSPLIWEIDVIEGPVIIPEPAAAALLGLGAAMFVGRRRKA